MSHFLMNQRDHFANGFVQVIINDKRIIQTTGSSLRNLVLGTAEPPLNCCLILPLTSLQSLQQYLFVRSFNENGKGLG